MNSSAAARYGDSVAFLLSQVGARSAQLFAADLAPLGVSPKAFGVLSNLASSDGRIQQELADALGIHRNNMVGLIDDLESAGWVERHRSLEDRRAFQVRLTPAGYALVDRVNKMVPALDANLTSELSPAERRELISLLQRLAAALDLHRGVHPYLGGQQPSGPALPST